MTALQCLDIDSTKLFKLSGVTTRYQELIIASINSCLLLGCLPATSFFSSDHKFSVGLRSGLFRRRDNSWSLWSLNHLMQAQPQCLSKEHQASTSDSCWQQLLLTDICASLKILWALSTYQIHYCCYFLFYHYLTRMQPLGLWKVLFGVSAYLKDVSFIGVAVTVKTH